MKQKINPIFIAFAIPALAVVFAVVFILLKKANVVSSSDEFPYATFLESPRSFEGNSYMMKAQIDSQLAYKPGSGKMLSVRTPQGARLSVFIPDQKGANLQVGQRYNLYVGINHDGLIVVNGLEKY
jgi:hypothetical protein